MMKRISAYWKALAHQLLVGAMCSLSSCEKIKELLETPEYPDENFTIVGTWEYYIPPLEGSAPDPGAVYNATGRVTFTEDMRFCFTLDTNRGEVKGYGTYTYDEDSGVGLIYDTYLDIEEYAEKKGLIHISSAGFSDHISWGNNDYGDRVEQDYLKVHSNIVSEYHRVATEPYEEEVIPYHDGSNYGIVSHNGSCCVNLPVSLDELYNRD